MIYNYSQEYKASDPSELERIMSQRHKNGMNEVLLAHDGHDYPVLSILMKDDIAALHYMVEGDRAGFASIGMCSKNRWPSAVTENPVSCRELGVAGKSAFGSANVNVA